MHWAPTTLTRKPSHSACSATSSKDTPGRTPPRSSRRSTPTSARHASGSRGGCRSDGVRRRAGAPDPYWKARAIRDAGEPFLAFYLSYDGYVQLGIEDSLIPTDPYFRAGMKSTPAGSRNIVTDPSPPTVGRQLPARHHASRSGGRSTAKPTRRCSGWPTSSRCALASTSSRRACRSWRRCDAAAQRMWARQERFTARLWPGSRYA